MRCEFRGLIQDTTRRTLIAQGREVTSSHRRMSAQLIGRNSVGWRCCTARQDSPTYSSRQTCRQSKRIIAGWPAYTEAAAGASVGALNRALCHDGRVRRLQGQPSTASATRAWAKPHDIGRQLLSVGEIGHSRCPSNSRGSSSTSHSGTHRTACAPMGCSTTTCCMSFNRAQAACGGSNRASCMVTLNLEGVALRRPGRRYVP
jgi:hypothetical protein